MIFFFGYQLLNIESARKVQKSTTKVVKEMKRIDVRKNMRMKTKKKKLEESWFQLGVVK